MRPYVSLGKLKPIIMEVVDERGMKVHDMLVGKKEKKKLRHQVIERASL